MQYWDAFILLLTWCCQKPVGSWCRLHYFWNIRGLGAKFKPKMSWNKFWKLKWICRILISKTGESVLKLGDLDGDQAANNLLEILARLLNPATGDSVPLFVGQVNPSLQSSLLQNKNSLLVTILTLTWFQARPMLMSSTCFLVHIIMYKVADYGGSCGSASFAEYVGFIAISWS